MVDQYRPRHFEFEQNYPNDSLPIVANAIANDCVTLAQSAMHFARVERVPRYDETSRENDAEHSFMLGLVAQELAGQYFPELEVGLVSQFATVHDLVELETGDIATFDLPAISHIEKAAREHDAVEKLCRILPTHTALLLRTYEQQALPEARFVRFIDKLLPVLVNILGPGSKVMHEDYATFDREQLERAEEALRVRFERMFPEPLFAPIHMARNSLARQFSELFTPLPQLQDVLF